MVLSQNKNICIIPARKGSKRVIKKNIRNFAGMPLVNWTIEAALKSKLFDEIILSSDSEKILDIGRKYGLNVNNIRPPELSGDKVSASEVIAYHLADYIDVNVCYLQPTSPLRSEIDILESYRLLTSKNYDAVVSVCEHPTPQQWIYDEEINFGTFISNLTNKRSQDFSKHFFLNGAIFWCKSVAFFRNKTHLIGENISPYVMPRDRSIDIDDEFDFKLAELIKLNN